MRDERGIAVIGSAVIVALAIFMGFGAAVIVRRNGLLHQAKLSRQRIEGSIHEQLDVSVNRNEDSAVVTLVNSGSVPSAAETLVIKRSDGSLDAKSELESRDAILVEVMGEKKFTASTSENYGDDNLGVYTRLGNVYWED